MSASSAIDVHAHFFPTGEPPVDRATYPRVPRLVLDGPESGRIVRGDADFRTVRPGLWDVGARLADLDAAGVERQLISPVPVTLDYAADPDGFAAYCRWINDETAKTVAISGGRLIGAGIVPAHAPDHGVGEVQYMADELGLRAVEIGTRVGDLELDDPRLDPFFATVARVGLAVLVHPVGGGGGALRRTGFTYDFGLGMPSDTALAATALVFGGVLDRHPDLRVVLVHGCGTFPWAYPRLRLGAEIAATHDLDRLDAAVGRLYADTLVFDPTHLELLVHRFGSTNVVTGSDYPFIPGQPADGIRDVHAAAERLPADVVSKILRDNAITLLERP